MFNKTCLLNNLLPNYTIDYTIFIYMYIFVLLQYIYIYIYIYIKSTLIHLLCHKIKQLYLLKHFLCVKTNSLSNQNLFCIRLKLFIFKYKHRQNDNISLLKTEKCDLIIHFLKH